MASRKHKPLGLALYSPISLDECRVIKNRRASREWARARTPEQKAEISLRAKQYRAANREKCRFWKKDWQQRNPEKQREIENNNRRNRRKAPRGRLLLDVRKAMRDSLKGHLATGTIGHFVERFGYTVEDLRVHLERQFLKGMTWENWSRDGWHLEHVLPLASFKFTSPDDLEFRAAWALTNLRPMWATDNIRKGARRLTLL